jgi:hypothetical protein
MRKVQSFLTNVRCTCLTCILERQLQQQYRKLNGRSEDVATSGAVRGSFMVERIATYTIAGYKVGLTDTLKCIFFPSFPSQLIIANFFIAY